jgi:hypothetical protein
MAITLFRSGIQSVTDLFFRGVGLAPSNFRVWLCNGSSFTDASDMLAVVQQVAAQQFGAGPKALSLSAPSWDAGQTRLEYPQVTCTWTASGGQIPYDRYVIVANANATNCNREVLAIDDSANKLTFDLATAHGLVADDVVVVTADVGGTVPSALLNAGQPRLLYVRNPVDTGSERSIQLALTAGGSPIDFGAGTGPIRVRYANGSIVAFDSISGGPIADGGTLNVNINLNFGNSGVNLG